MDITTEPEHEIAQRRSWPSPLDYSEAVQTPNLSFVDEELRNGLVETTQLGLPRSMSGNFASVYCFQCETRKVAVRCFLHNIPDQQSRYQSISEFVRSDDLPYTVAFEYMAKGIKVEDNWYPILKMEWVEGVTLNQFINQNVTNALALNLSASYFKQMMLELRRAGIAHGDLQHDNILMANDEIRLVDYDGMFVPSLQGHMANELGHASYQHPQRDQECFGPQLDNFSAWVIYTSLRALGKDYSLWNKLKGGRDGLLFDKLDFTNPEQSYAFKVLQQHPERHIRELAFAIRHYLELPLHEIPPLDAPVSQYTKIHRQAGEHAAKTNSIQLPEWLHIDSHSLPPATDLLPIQSPEQQTVLDNNTAAPLENKFALLIDQSLNLPRNSQSQPKPPKRNTDPVYPSFSSIGISPNTHPLIDRTSLSQLSDQLLPGETILWANEHETYERCAFRRHVTLLKSLGILLLALEIGLALLHNSYVMLVLVLFAIKVAASSARLQPCIRALLVTEQRILLICERRSQGQSALSVHTIPLETISHISTYGHECRIHARNNFYFTSEYFGTNKQSTTAEIRLLSFDIFRLNAFTSVLPKDLRVDKLGRK